MKGKIYKIFYGLIYKNATSILHGEESIRELLAKYYKKLKEVKIKEEIGKPLLSNLKTYVRLIKAYKEKRYTHVSKIFILSLTAGIIYFIMPIDAISDFVPGGYIDDLAIITYLFNRFNKEINDFLIWEKEMVGTEEIAENKDSITKQE